MADNLKIIKCPACNHEMVKVFVKSAGVNVDICANGCGGIYFDNREYQRFDEENENIEEIIQVLNGKTFIHVDEEQKRYCPVCNTPMVKNYSSVKKEIMVDDCYNCGGKFLDYGELQKIRAEYKTDKDRTEDFMRVVYATVGKELMVLDENNKEEKKKRSLLRRLFDKMFDL